MARVAGSFSSGSNYELSIRRPLDARQLVTKISDLTAESTWTKAEGGYNNAYNGMIVACVEDASIYILKDRNNLTSLEDGWVKLGRSDHSGIFFVNQLGELPNVGRVETLYVVLDKNITMYWDLANLKYSRIGTDWRDVEIIDGGHAEFTKEKLLRDYTPSISV